MPGSRIAKIGPLKGLCGDAGAGLHKGIYRALIGILKQYWEPSGEKTLENRMAIALVERVNLTGDFSYPNNQNKGPCNSHVTIYNGVLILGGWGGDVPLDRAALNEWSTLYKMNPSSIGLGFRVYRA